jgi:FkbM family methyltransferase
MIVMCGSPNFDFYGVFYSIMIHGDTAMRLYRNALSQNRGGYGSIKIIAFEPDPQIYNMLKRYCEPIKTIIPKCAATYSSTTQLTFDSDENNKGGGLAECTNTNTKDKRAINMFTVDAVAIDDIVECADATFIKMDVEAA